MKTGDTDTPHKVAIVVAILFGIYVLSLFLGGFPMPRGNKVNSDYYTYYKNFRGIYYISVEHSLALINRGHWGYLENADKSTFTVLDDNWAKDARHVWFGDKLIEDVDVPTFHISASGVPVDKNNVYIRDFSDSNTTIKPSESGIDVETAEYFVYRVGARQHEWMRDKDNVYHYDKKVDVDRNTFKIFAEDWFIDKSNLYITTYNSQTKQNDLCRIDSLQNPVEAGYLYLRNGRNIIYGDSVIVRDIEVKRFEEIGVGKYLINDMLFLWGKPFLKDSLDVKNAKFYFYGHIAADSDRVFFYNTLLDDIDAATFKQTDDRLFEDKDYIYMIKDRAWSEKYPFDKKKK